MNHSQSHKLFNIVVIVAALGYFVDIYDLIIFGIVKNPSLMDLGLTDKDALFNKGNFILSMQMAGMLIGGIVWGVLGDKKGRLSILFMTILLYSIANIANGFVTSIGQYAWLRFIAGFGLSGEFGLGVTLVSEVMSKEKRGLGASIVSGIGILGAVLAFVVAERFNWRVAYWAGGGLGLALLFLRIAVIESGMYKKAKTQQVSKGNFFALFTDKKRFRKFLFCTLLALPTWYTVSVLAINAPSFAQDALGITGTVKGSASVMLHYIGAAIGSFLFGYISLLLRSRKKAIILATSSIAVLTAIYFSLFGASSTLFYLVLFVLGIPMGGLWAIFVAAASEQFGTNIRATVTTTAPNFVRGATILITFLLGTLTPVTGLWSSGVIVGVIFIGIALWSVFLTEETYGKDLDYVEEID
ncbi:MAG TPA: MFS transporter [Bacteroidales bacterium]|nr:MFS transporter [Bacteroidales bacterium]